MASIGHLRLCPLVAQIRGRRAGLLGKRGPIVGKFGGRLLRFSDVEGSVGVFAPQGAGKGVGVVVPNLLTYAGSVICTDPKGENHAITARAGSGRFTALMSPTPPVRTAPTQWTPFAAMTCWRWKTAAVWRNS